MYILPILSGIFSKIYDDIEDNPFLSQFKTPFIMELLKGLEYVSFTVMSLADPLFLIIIYIVSLISNKVDKDAFASPYEKSLFFSYFLLFFIVDYSKINKLGIYEYVALIMLFLGIYIEPSTTTEYSVSKMMGQILAIIILFPMAFLSMFSNLKTVFFYYTGYMLCSIIVQAYSLFHHKEQKEKVKEIKKKEKKIKDGKLKI